MAGPPVADVNKKMMGGSAAATRCPLNPPAMDLQEDRQLGIRGYKGQKRTLILLLTL